MKFKILYCFLIVLFIITITSCKSDKMIDEIIKNDTNEKVANNLSEVNSMKILIDNKEYIFNLEDNESARDFVNLLPKEFEMNELNGNEKYTYLDSHLPTDPYNPKKINTGDVMLYGDDCLVIFYKTFTTSYSYTKIGHIDNLTDLGNGSIKVKFEKIIN